jgi:methyl-accepting chemotaxis protein
MKINLDSLVVKIIFFGVMLVFTSLLIFSSIFILNQRSEIPKQILEKGLIFTEFSAQSIYSDYISFYTQSSDQNFLLLKEQLQSKLAKNSDIINVSLVSVNGRILFDSQELTSGRYTSDKIRALDDPESLRLLKNIESSYRETTLNGRKIAEIFVPIKEVSGSPVFIMRYVLSFDSFNQKMMVIYRQAALSFLIVFMLVFLLSIPLYLNISKPIIKLNALTKKISEGDFSVKADLGTSKDELGVLAKNFNVMVDELRSSKEKTTDYSKKLEKEVGEKASKIEEERLSFAKELEYHKKEIAALEKKNQELEKLNQFMVDRELKMVELKKKLGEKG